MKDWKNKLYFGDCLEVLRELYDSNKEGFIDLIYNDPPFNSKRDYNILFEGIDLKDAKAQKEAFADTWSNVSYKDTLQEIKEMDLDLFEFIQSLDKIRISKSAVSYLTMMAIRISYMHKLLKETGSFYLHCDPNMSHYLKIVCDLIFGEKNFRNEIVWKRKSGRGESNYKSNKFGQMHDIILFYAKSEKNVFNQFLSMAIAENYIKERFRYKNEDGRLYMRTPLNSPNLRENLKYEYKGYQPPEKGWAVSREVMERMDKEGRLYFPPDKNQKIYRKIFIDEYKGQPIQSIWTDIPFINPMAKERLGYPTQKPEALLERIITSSSNEGDLVADFFCGCGTLIIAAETSNRKWLGVDISHLSVGLMERRLQDTFGDRIKGTFEIHGFPKDVASAEKLAQNPEGGRFEFQDWIIEAKLGGICNPKKTADGGWDGYLTFYINDKEKDIVLIEVKSGNVNVKNLREFIQVVNKKGAAIGAFICFSKQVTKPMLLAAKEEGYYRKEIFGNMYDKIQIITVEDLLENKGINMPATTKGIFKSAENIYKKQIRNSKVKEEPATYGDDIQNEIDFK